MQNNTKIDKTLLSILSSDHMISNKFTETIQDVLKIYVSCNTQQRQELSICLFKVKGHLSANFAKSKYAMLMLHFCQYHANPATQIMKKTHVNGLEASSSNA